MVIPIRGLIIALVIIAGCVLLPFGTSSHANGEGGEQEVKGIADKIQITIDVETGRVESVEGLIGLVPVKPIKKPHECEFPDFSDIIGKKKKNKISVRSPLIINHHGSPGCTTYYDPYTGYSYTYCTP